MAILPATKLHFNMGVCHQRLALAAESPEQRTRERDAAIDSYNAYLELNPRADDRLSVAATIRNLGGTPSTMPTLIDPVFERTPVPETEAETADTDTDPDTDTDTDIKYPSSGPARPKPTRGRIGIAVIGGIAPQLIAASQIDANTLTGLELHAGGFVGRQKRFLLAAHLGLLSGSGSDRGGLTFFNYGVGLLAEQTWVLGRGEGRLMIGIGGIAALTGQSLSERKRNENDDEDDIQNGDAVLCAVDSGTTVAWRTGVMLAPRGEFNVLLGLRRRSMVGLFIQPSVSVFADGPDGSRCKAGEGPWDNVGVVERTQVRVEIGVGYSFRF